MTRLVARGLVVLVTLSLALGCIVDLNAYGLRAKVDAQEEPLSTDEVKELREIARKIASAQDLTELDGFKGEAPTEEIFDLYTVLDGPSGNVALYVAEDRQYAHIQVDDWNSAGSVNEWTRAVMDKVLERLAKRLPGRPVEVETRDMGFWAP